MIHIYRDPHYIKEFSIYGERHSGTNFLEGCIKQTFEIPLTYSLGFKHWFGFTKPESILFNRQILFFGIVRHPYDWISGFFNMPHHIPKCNKNNILNFLQNEWYSVDRDNQEIIGDRNFSNRFNPSRYRNIFELRQQKCLYLYETMPMLAKNYILLSYEFLLSHNNKIMQMIGERFQLKKIGHPPPVLQKSKVILDPHIKYLVDSNIDWATESLFGFYPR